jgi:hypothetical protein
MDDHIAVKIDGVVYVKLEDVKPMRYRIDELEAALREIADLNYKEAAINGAAYFASMIARVALVERGDKYDGWR